MTDVAVLRGLATGLLFVAAIWLLRWLELHSATRRSRLFRLRFPREMAVGDATTFVAGLSGVRPPWFWRWLRLPTVTFEVHAHEGRIEHLLVVPRRLTGIVLSQLRAALPSVRLDPVTDHEPDGPVTTGRELRVSTRRRPLRTDRLEGVSAALLTSLLPLKEGERAVVQWSLSPALVPRPPRLPDRSAQPTLGPQVSADGYDLSPHGEALRAERDKRSEPLFVSIGRVAVQAELPERSRYLLDRILGSYQLLTAAGVELRPRWLLPPKTAAQRVMRRSVPVWGWPAVLNASELVGVIGWPVGATQLPGVDLGGCRQLPPSVDISAEGYVIGRATYPGSERPIAIAEEDRNTHVSITGPTGSGKSNLLQSLIVEDMQRGRGCVVVDVKGDLVNECLDRVPKERVKEVVLVDPSDLERPVGINFLSTEDTSKELRADQVTQTFHLLFEAFWGPRSDDLLRASILTLMRDPAMTMVELVPLLTSEAFRRRFVAMVQDDPVGLAPFWAGYIAMRPQERAQTIAPVMNKLRQILLRPAVRNCVGQSTSRLDLGQAISAGRLVFIRLPEGLLGDEAASLLGSLLVGRVWSLAQARIGLAEGERRPCTLYLDEAHRLVGSAISLDNMLAQARATKLSLVLATQHLTQWPTELRQAVLSNARSKVVFQPSARDAQLYQAEFKPYLTAEDLQGLGRFEIVAQLAVGQRVAPPVTATTSPPSKPSGTAERCRAWSREHYGTSRDDIEAELRARHATASSKAPIGRQTKPRTKTSGGGP